MSEEDLTPERCGKGFEPCVLDRGHTTPCARGRDLPQMCRQWDRVALARQQRDEARRLATEWEVKAVALKRSVRDPIAKAESALERSRACEIELSEDLVRRDRDLDEACRLLRDYWEALHSMAVLDKIRTDEHRGRVARLLDGDDIPF